MAERPRRACRSVAVSSSESGASRIVDELTLPPPQPGRRVEELGAGGADDEQRHPARPVHEVVDEVEQRVVGPVQVFEDEDERPLARRSPPGSGARRRTPRRAGRWPSLVRLEADQRMEVPLDPAASASSRTNRCDGLAELLARLLGTVGLEDPGLRLDHLAERPERHAFAVRKRAAVAPVDEAVRRRSRSSGTARRRAGSCRSGDADERHELRLAFARHAGERLAQERQLPLAAHERGAADHAPRRRARARSSASQTATRLRLALRLDRLRLAVLDRALGCAEGRLVDEDPVRPARPSAGAPQC